MKKEEYDFLSEVAAKIREETNLRYTVQELKKLFDWFDKHNGDLSTLTLVKKVVCKTCGQVVFETDKFSHMKSHMDTSMLSDFEVDQYFE